MVNKKFFNFFTTSLIIFIISLFFNKQTFAANPQFSLKIIYVPQCMDGRDNDGDGLIDYPADPDCTSPTDDNEGPHSKVNLASSVIFIQGRTIPNAKIKILKDGKILIYAKSDDNGNFSQSIYGFYHGDYSFSVTSETKNKTTTNLVNFNVSLNPGSYISVTDVYVSPTISSSVNEVKKGENINIDGYGLSESDVQIFLQNKKDNTEKILNTIKTNKQGYYIYQFDTKDLLEGNYVLYSKNLLSDTIVGSSKNIDINILISNDKIKNSENYNNYKVKCDLNGDGNVDLIDFSILLFHWLASDYKEGDFNNDGIIDIKDFSIMAYNWTGD